MAGDRKFFGYTSFQARLDDIFDALNVNTQVSGNWKKAPPEFPRAPRPTDQAPSKKKKRTVREMYGQFVAGTSGGGGAAL